MSGGEEVRVLIVEDNPADAELLEVELRRGGYEPRALRVATAEAMQAALDSASWDLVLSDFDMPRFDGMRALELLKATGKDIPFILISGQVGEDLAVNAMRAGAHDFFVKGQIGLLVSAIRRELRESKLRATARAQREQLFQNEKLAAMGTLLAGVAHELNNPLFVIMTQATLLQRTLDGDARQARSNEILQAVKRCARIVRNFLALARHEPPQRVPVSIGVVVRDVVELLSYGFRVDGIKTTLDLDRPVPKVRGDPHQLQQVVVNLMSNAQYALRSRTAPRRLTLRSAVDVERGQVMLYVEDNAGGIPPEIRSRIFEPFFTTKPEGQGTGLGLALCHGIISAHQGSITVQSEVGSGTTFAIGLPFACVEEPSDRAKPVLKPVISGQRILVVDDDPDVASSISEGLLAQGHRVDLAPDGKIALQLLDQGAYDVVMTDVRMPELDGPTLYREVVARHPLLEHRFVFLTGDTFSPETDRFLSQTSAVHISKPCSLEEIENAVQRVLRQPLPAAHIH